MANRAKIPNLREALARREFPTVTTWNRIEGRPRSVTFDRALAAEVRDALWMLTRQWQVGEFQGEDGGSPVLAQYHLRTTRATRYRPREEAPEEVTGTAPLEAVVERRRVPFQAGADPLALDLRLAMGRRWLRMVPVGLRARFVDRYEIAAPDPGDVADTTLVAHAEVWSMVRAVAGRTMDGYALYQHIVDGGAAGDGMPDLTDQERAAIDEAAPRFVAWFDDLISQPAGAGAWDPARLEHRFALGLPAEQGERVVVAEEYPGGHLDWYSFSHDPDDLGLGATDPAVRADVTRTVFPGVARFSGMPHPRWWALEDGRTNFAAVTPDTTDLIRLLFLEFALVYSNDWMLLPCDLPTGTLATIDGLVVTDVFGQRFWITPAGTGPDQAWQRWSMYNLDIAGDAAVAADLSLFLPPGLSTATEGPALEDVVLVRDENANMVWGVERTVLLAIGEGRRGAEAAAETLAHRRRLAPPVPAVTPAAPIAYEAMNTVPEHWIPFIPVHMPGDTREIQLQRAAMPRLVAGQTPPEKVPPRTTLLREGLEETPPRPYFVHEEEVPRAGTRVTLAYNRTRWYGGRVLVWLSARRATGRGEGASGLAFDRLADTPASP
jgi:hypothetical protein